MSREIKFRAWDKGLNKFLNSSNRNIEFLKTYLDCIDQSDHGAASFSITENGIILQQFTGLLDKNGKEIYEGDILIYRYRSEYEIWKGEEFVGWSDDEKDFYSLHSVEFFNDEFEVNCSEYTILINGWGTKQIYNSDETNSMNKRRKTEICPIGGQIKVKNYGFFGANSKSFEIFGNTFENPELL